MAQNPEMHLWRAVLVLALRDDDATRWLRTQGAATVFALAGLDHTGVIRAYRARLAQIRKRAA